MGRTFLYILIYIVAGCSGHPDCPPCGEGGDSSAVADSGSVENRLEESDAGFEPGAKRARPREVSSFPLHGRAGFPRVSIFQNPDMMSRRLGYLRLGERRMVGDCEYATEKCPKGWFKLKEGGYVCQGRGLLVGTKPRFIKRVPPKPRIDELDPHPHGFVRRDWTPSYKRLPLEEEIWHPPTPDVDTDGILDAGAEPEEPIPHVEDGADGGVDYYKYTKKNFRAVNSLLSRGFWISIANRIREENTRSHYYETVGGEFVPTDNIHPVSPPESQGYRVLGDTPLPAVIIRTKKASFYRAHRRGFRGSGPASRLASYPVLETRSLRKEEYYRIDNTRWLREKHVAVFRLREPPDGLGLKDKWVHVDLTHQTLEAYEGPTPVYVTLVSTGLPDSEETLTPKGTFRVRFKHLTDNMRGTVGDDDVYSVEDVPWVQYIHRNIAFHAAFWHSSFGSPKSHGCINLSPADARWLFNWTEPALPDGWHGVAETPEKPGTPVIVEGMTPKK